MPVRLAASALASSNNARPIMQLSTTTMATRVLSSASTMARALTAVLIFATDRLVIPPLTKTGRMSPGGVTSMTAAPAWKSARAGVGATARMTSPAVRMARERVFMVSEMSCGT